MNSEPSTLAAILEDLSHIFTDHIPFNRTLGMRLSSLSAERGILTFEMREDLVGNFLRGSLHGGVTASVLDTVGGIVAFASVIDRENLDLETARERLGNLGTIDLRIDYLRSGQGRSFVAEAEVLRTGNKVAVSRMELRNEEGMLIAVGTGTYLVG